MKHIKRYKGFIDKIYEDKYVNQIVYHFTSEQSIIDIIKCDCLMSINTGTISVTRDKYQKKYDGDDESIIDNILLYAEKYNLTIKKNTY